MCIKHAHIKSLKLIYRHKMRFFSVLNGIVEIMEFQSHLIIINMIKNMLKRLCSTLHNSVKHLHLPNTSNINLLLNSTV